MSLYPCTSIEHARTKLTELSNNTRSVTYLYIAPKSNGVRTSIVNLPEYEHLTSDVWASQLIRVVAFGVYYGTTTSQRDGRTGKLTEIRTGGHLDFWGFISIDSVLLQHELSTRTLPSISLKRDYFVDHIESLPQCDSSFEMYIDYHELGGSYFNLDQIDALIQARIELYQFVLHQRPKNMLGSKAIRMLHLSDENAVNGDAWAYRLLLVFLSSTKASIENRNVADANLGIWQRAEIGISEYRICCCMSVTDYPIALHHLDGRFNYIRTTITSDIIRRIVEGTHVNDDDDDTDEPPPLEQRVDALRGDEESEYESCLKAALPIGDTFHRVPFEQCDRLIASRSVFVYHGFVYLHAVQVGVCFFQRHSQLHSSNRERCRNESRRGDYDGFFQDERIKTIYHRFSILFADGPAKALDSHRSGMVTAPQTIPDLTRAMPLCTLRLASNAVNRNNTNHNKFPERRMWIDLLLRYNAMTPFVQNLMVAKIKVSYADNQIISETNAVKALIESRQKIRRRNITEKKKEFRGSCSWIIFGSKSGDPSGITCPYMNTIKDEVKDRKIAPFANEYKMSLAATDRCRADFWKRSNLRFKPPVTVFNGPDDFIDALWKIQHPTTSSTPDSETIDRKRAASSI